LSSGWADSPGAASAEPNSAGAGSEAEPDGEGGAESDGEGEVEPDGEGEPESEGEGEGEAELDGAGLGAVGVGTGGSSQRQSDSVGCTVLTGLVTGGAGGTGVLIAGGPGRSRSTASVTSTTRLAGLVVSAGFAGPAPRPVFDRAVTAGGNVPAGGVCVSNELKPFTTPRYAPAAPATASTTNPVITVARRGHRRGRPDRARGVARPDPGRSVSPPNVFMPVEVTSAPSENDSGGPGRDSVRVLRDNLIRSVLRSRRTGVLPVPRCSGTL